MTVRGVLLDIDGVLTVSWEPLPGAADALAELSRREVPYRLVTNTSSRTRAEMARLLADAVNDGDLRPELEHVDVTEDDDVDVVLLGGAGAVTGYAEFDRAFRAVQRGAALLALHRNTRYQTADGPALDMGAFLLGIEAATGVEATILGKPAAPLFNAALADVGVPAEDGLMVGDDLDADVRGAQALGMTGVLVRTGKFRPADLEHGSPAPDHVIDDVSALPSLIDELS